MRVVPIATKHPLYSLMVVSGTMCYHLLHVTSYTVVARSVAVHCI